MPPSRPAALTFPALLLVPFLAVLLAGNAAAQGELPRHALVIGNSAYPVGALQNPGNDARAMAERLREAGFQVTLKLDARRHEAQEAIRGFTASLAKSKGIGLFYYAGHGVQLNWRNFLVPVDAKIRTQADIQAQTVDLGLLLDGLARARNALNVIVLDACRNNPFGADFRVSDRGLSQLDAPPGTFLAYATAPGNTAEDGEGSHGLYTDRLLKEMTQPGAAIEDIFKRVRLSVRRGSQGAQIPWESTSLEGDFRFLAGPPANRDEQAEFRADLAAWEDLRKASSTEQLEAFIRQRPSGKFAEMAQFRLEQLLAARGEKPVRARAGGPQACQPGKDEAGAAAPYAGPAVDFRAGETYRYRRIDLLSRAELGERREAVERLAGDEVHFADGKTVTDRFGNQVRAPDGRKWTPYQFFIADYQLGKRWPAQFLVTQADGTQLSMEFELRVAARERITLPAGTFDAFRIEARGRNHGNGDVLERTAWVAPEKMRGFLAMESLVRRDGLVVSGERTELLQYRHEPPDSGAGSRSSYL
jgi:hypothetical protein